MFVGRRSNEAVECLVEQPNKRQSICAVEKRNEKKKRSCSVTRFPDSISPTFFESLVWHSDAIAHTHIHILGHKPNTFRFECRVDFVVAGMFCSITYKCSRLHASSLHSNFSLFHRMLARLDRFFFQILGGIDFLKGLDKRNIPCSIFLRFVNLQCKKLSHFHPF